jgi:hypothetical protein
MNYIVTTTIFPPSKALQKFSQMEGWTLIVVGDKKTPHHLYKDFPCIYMDPEYQETHYKELSDLIGWNCIQRRNLGYIEAYKRGAEIIASVDDDNIPLDGWENQVILGEGKQLSCYTYTPQATDTKVWDPLSATEYKHLWHRGFPLDKIQEKNKLNCSVSNVSADIQAAFWNGDPDVDAIERLVYLPQCLFAEHSFPFTGTVVSPFNSQNTFFTRKAIKDFFLFPHVGRMDGIWGSYYAQAKGLKPVYTKATVYQERNEHDFLVDFSKEIIGYQNNYKLIQSLLEDPEHIQRYVPEHSYKALKVYQAYFT